MKTRSLLFMIGGLFLALPLFASASTLSSNINSGPAPLAVTFASTDVVDSTGATFSIDFGDGITQQVTCSGGGIASCEPPVTMGHTYQTARTFTARLLRVSTTTTVVSTRVITVSASIYPTCQLHVSPSVISPNGTVTISWTSSNATSGAITNVGNVSPVGSGSRQVVPPLAQITTYVGSFTNATGQTANCTASVQVSYGNTTGTTGTGGTGTDGTVVTPNPIPSGGTSQSGTSQSTSNQGALVQCGVGIGTAAVNCEACNLAQLAQNIINFLIGLSIPIAAVLFAWAGILYFSSGANPGNIEKAKDIFKNALVGFLIAITAWIVINTLLHALLDGGRLFNGGSNWFTVKCAPSGTRPVNEKVETLLNKVLTGVNTSQSQNTSGTGGSSGTGGYIEPTSYSTCYSGDATLANGDCQGAFGETYSAFTQSSGSQGPEGNCPSGYRYTEDTDYAWCQGTGGADDIVDFSSGGAAGSAPNCTIQNCGSVAAAAQAYYGVNTSAGPDNGNLACAWAVNNVLNSAGIASVDGNSVQSMMDTLDAGRGYLVSQNSAVAGDIVIEKYAGVISHVGICQNDGCTSVISNSSSDATFTRISDATFGTGLPPRIYHLR